VDAGADRFPGEPQGCAGAYEEPYGDGKNPKVGERWHCASALVMESYIPINLYWYILVLHPICSGLWWLCLSFHNVFNLRQDQPCP